MCDYDRVSSCRRAGKCAATVLLAIRPDLTIIPLARKEHPLPLPLSVLTRPSSSPHHHHRPTQDECPGNVHLTPLLATRGIWNGILCKGEQADGNFVLDQKRKIRMQGLNKELA